MDFNAFLKLVSPAAISMNWNEAQTNADPYLGEALFPRKQKAGLDLKWFRGYKGLPVALMPSAFDAQATYRDRIGVKAVETEMPFFREGFKIKEKDRQNVLRAIDTKDPYVREIIATVFDDAGQLIEGRTMQELVPEFIDKVLSVASGEKARNEENDYREISIFKNGVTL